MKIRHSTAVVFIPVNPDAETIEKELNKFITRQFSPEKKDSKKPIHQLQWTWFISNPRPTR